MKDAKGHGSDKRGGGSAAGDILARLGVRGPVANAAVRAAQLTDQQAAATLAQGGAKSAMVPVHNGAAGRTDNPLAGMTQEKWNSMSQSEREGVRDNSSLTPQLKGLEGHRVEVKDTAGQGTRRFIVGKSTGWKPIHLEIARRDSSGGGGASKSYGSVRDLGKVR